jgi:hypothetical protein
MISSYYVLSRLGKRSVGRSQARWSDDLRRMAGRSWMRVAEDRARWQKVERPMSCSGLMMMMMMFLSIRKACLPVFLLWGHKHMLIQYIDVDRCSRVMAV